MERSGFCNSVDLIGIRFVVLFRGHEFTLVLFQLLLCLSVFSSQRVIPGELFDAMHITFFGILSPGPKAWVCSQSGHWVLFVTKLTRLATKSSILSVFRSFRLSLYPCASKPSGLEAFEERTLGLYTSESGKTNKQAPEVQLPKMTARKTGNLLKPTRGMATGLWRLN